MTIRFKLALLIGLLLFGVVAAVGVGWFWTERVHLIRQGETTRRVAMDQFALTCGDAYAVRDDIALLNAAETVAETPGAQAAYFVDPEGRIAGHSDVAQIGKPEPSTPPDTNVLRSERTIPLRGGRQGRAVILYSRSALDRLISAPLAHTRSRILAVSLAGLLAGLLGAWIMARHLTRPIHDIVRAAQTVAQGRYGERLRLARKDELGRLADDFDRMAERLGELDEMKRDFVSNVTHELRSPLSAIVSCVNAMMDDFRSGERGNTLEYLSLVRNNAARLGRFINDLLDVSRIEARRWDLDLKPVSVEEIVSDVVELFNPQARERDIRLTAGNLPKGLTINADSDKLHQILFNLVGNALKFTPSGGSVFLAATIVSADSPPAKRARKKGARSASSFVALSVEDTGCGIPPEDIDRVFDRFEQVRRNSGDRSTPKGTGLGLSICRGWAEAHGGAVLAESVQGRGSVFTLILPEGVGS